MTKKLFGAKQITHLLYGFVMLLPMFMILSKSCYTIFNKNAKDSYSAQHIYKEFKINNENDINNELVYTMNYKAPTTLNSSAYNLTYISLTYIDLNITESNYDNITKWVFNGHSLKFLNTSGQTIAGFEWNDNTPDNLKTFNFIGSVGNYWFSVATITRVIFVQDKLDNAFEYSLDSFIKDNNFGNVDFFSWFTNLFLDQTNTHNALYLHFTNWYLNYALLVSSGYLLFLALIWFVNYVRRILDKSMNHDLGGF